MKRMDLIVDFLPLLRPLDFQQIKDASGLFLGLAHRHQQLIARELLFELLQLPEVRDQLERSGGARSGAGS